MAGFEVITEEIDSKTELHNTGYIDKQGHYLVKPKFPGGGDFSDGFAAVEDNMNKWGYIAH